LLEISGHGLEEYNVIAPFTVYATKSQINNGAEPSYEYAGLNWTAEGEAFCLAGCTFTATPDCDLTGNTGEVCLGDEVTIAAKMPAM
jgi:hypothetical protein